MRDQGRATRLAFGVYEVDLRTRELHKNGRTILLQPQVFAALAKLLDEPGRVVSREELRREIWPADTFVDFETGLNSIMRRVRQTIADDAETPRYIETLPRIGYRFIAPVNPVLDNGEVNAAPVATPVEETDGALLSARSRPLTHGWLLLLGAAGLLLIIVFGRTLAVAAQHKQEAQRAYQMGVYELGRWTPDDLARSANYFEQAVRYDETNAAAWAGMARSYTLLAALQLVPSQAAVERAKGAALKAVGRDPSSAEAHTAMAGVLMSEWSWTAAEAELHRALSLDPGNADAHQLYGYWLLTQAQGREAVAEMRRAQMLDPHSPNKRNSLAAALFQAHRFDDALAIWRETSAVEANNVRRHQRLAFIYDVTGMRTDSMAEMMAVLRVGGQTAASAEVEHIFRAKGYAAAREAFYRAQLARDSAGRGEQYQIAADHVAVGENDRALEALSRAVAAHETGVTYVSLDPRFDPLRSDIRFAALLRTIGLPQSNGAAGQP